MSRVDRLAGAITDHSRAVIVALLLLSVAIGAGAGGLSQSSSLDQFQSDTPESRALSYVNSNFSSQSENTTSVQLIMRDDDVLDRESLLKQLAFERAIRENETVNGTLAPGQPPTGIANVIASTAIYQERGQNLAARGQELQQRSRQLNATRDRLVSSLNRTRDLQAQYDELNSSRRRGDVDNATYRQRSQRIESQLSAVRTNATGNLSRNATATYTRLFEQTRTLQQRLDQTQRAYEQGQINQSTYRERTGQIQQGFQRVYRGVGAVLAPQYQQLQADAQALQEDRQELRNASQSGGTPPLSEQRAQLESMNASEIDRTVETVLGEQNGRSSNGAGAAFALMPTGYEPGSTEANATMLIVTQSSEGGSATTGSASDRLIASQNAIQDIARETLGADSLVFGGGIIADEIERSMTDSLAIVGPLALLFVLLVLIVAYRDLVDIVLGLLGIALVLVWTFGFMGHLDMAFNQIMIAVPVLLIGLSIDYAIHVFMRHREERATHESSVRGSMKMALASVGVALALVTATTVIGFLSNLTSSVPPIRDFGIASAFGIVAAMVIFAALVPALKVEIDGFLEKRGFDREKRAFGTGGGALGRLLSGGTTAARKAPWIVVIVALLISAGGAYGATQVDTSFAQEDFLADQPADWMYDLPEPFAPSQYSAKASLDYVNENFIRQDTSAEILARGEITRPDTLERLSTAQSAAANKSSTVVLSNGEADITSPLTVMRSVAAENRSFRQVFRNADTDGNGVPDQDVGKVYDALFAAAPDQAGTVINREGGDYEAFHMSVAVKGGASGGAVTEQMNEVESILDGNGLRATATGTPIVFKLVQDQLLETVIESLLITLVAVFAFLMLAYRITDGSATLGFVTLLPVLLSVTWILGTMYLMGIPFNVLTGMITSLTVGLGVAYSIHISERYVHELERLGSVWEAMRTTVTGTGGALLGSAATTVGGFGVLSFAILPPLRQFGVITGLTIIYAFLASVLVLPSLLVIWTRYLGPDGAFETTTSTGPAPTED